MDSYEGVTIDPLSLHKYIYCQGNPVNKIDPSGNYDQDEGYAMERLIMADYQEAHPMADVGGSGAAGIGENPDLRPDILNKTAKTFAEIKPLTMAKISLGLRQLDKYEASLSGIGYVRDQWPSDSFARLRMVFYNWNPYFYFNVNGLILYTRIDPGTLFVPISVGGAKSLASYSTKALVRGSATTLESVAGRMALRAVAIETADVGIGVATASLTAFSGVQQ